ncbi:MAG TPA: DUF6798 domain-containing protein [Anaerolineales bacterium]|nr:DUF6798 domain-containing protein [Anaerolineales bacterium]
MPHISARYRRILEAIGWSAAFALSYAQSPLYTSNQNQYFLHGLARAGVGFLRDDWLVHTAEPTPVFSWMVGAVASTVPTWTFYLLYAALMGIYLFSLLAIVSAVFDLGGGAKRTLTLAALVVLHSAALRYLLARLVAPEAEFLLEGGVAGQRLLGAVFQPSSFGILLVLSLALFLIDRRVGAVLALGAASAVHPTYLLSSGVILACYLLLTAANSQARRQATLLGLLGAALLAPTAAWAYVTFRPSGADLYARAADILIRLRLPHHAIPAKWLDATVAAQAAIVAAALVLVRRSRLFLILAVGSAFVVLATAIQMASGDPTLALLFPWRLSTVLVPVSTASLAAAVTSLVVERLRDRPAVLRGLLAASLLAVALAVATGVYRFQLESEQQRSDPAAPMMAFVAQTVMAGDVYFVPPKLQDFRLRTGAPIVVEAKAIPYRDRDVTEWYERLKLARLFFRGRPEWVECSVIDTVRSQFAATHVVLGPEQRGADCPQLTPLFDDGAYAVYRIAR